MRDTCVDVILCPAYSGVGALQGAPKYWNYTAIWNILDQPAVSFPSGTYADKDVDTWDAALEPRNAEEMEEWANCKWLLIRIPRDQLTMSVKR